MDAKVLDFIAHRKNNIEEKKRKFERVMFENVFGAYLVHEEAGSVFKMNLVDISYEGCLIEMPRINDNKKLNFEEGADLAFRLYFSDKSYIPVSITVARVIEKIEDGRAYIQIGCQFDQEVTSFEALRSFIDFIYKFAQYSQVDAVRKRAFFW